MPSAAASRAHRTPATRTAPSRQQLLLCVTLITKFAPEPMLVAGDTAGAPSIRTSRLIPPDSTQRSVSPLLRRGAEDVAVVLARRHCRIWTSAAWAPRTLHDTRSSWEPATARRWMGAAGSLATPEGRCGRTAKLPKRAVMAVTDENRVSVTRPGAARDSVRKSPARSGQGMCLMVWASGNASGCRTLRRVRPAPEAVCGVRRAGPGSRAPACRLPLMR